MYKYNTDLRFGKGGVKMSSFTFIETRISMELCAFGGEERKESRL